VSCKLEYHVIFVYVKYWLVQFRSSGVTSDLYSKGAWF
jgi:hypothetical protein